MSRITHSDLVVLQSSARCSIEDKVGYENKVGYGINCQVEDGETLKWRPSAVPWKTEGAHVCRQSAKSQPVSGSLA
jgi:hypothetical protein